jgi:hypothetical protein
MMYAELYQYLLQYKQLPVPGIGTFLLDRKPAAIDFPNRMVNAPVYSIALQSAQSSLSKRFFNWLGYALNISEREAVVKFNDFAFSLKKQIGEGDVVNWSGVGTLSKGLGGDIKFSPVDAIVHEIPVPAAKVIRDKAEHMVRVGEDHKTSAEMVEMLNQAEEKKSYWWTYALAVALLAVMFIGWYISEHGVDIAATANTAKLIPQEPPAATYQVLP